MNRKDFLKSLVAGVAIAPTLFTNKTGAAYAADFAVINRVDNPVSFRASGVDVLNHFVEMPAGNEWPEQVQAGRDFTIKGIDRSCVGSLESLITNREPRNYVISLPRGILVFTGLMEMVTPNMDDYTYTFRVCCTAKGVKYSEL